VFGLSFGEVVLLALIGMIVVGPRNLPTMLRTLGRTVSKLKRLTVEIREQTGIDEILKGEGIEKEMEQLRMIASGRILDVDLASDPADEHPPRYREYPRMGVDSYDAIPEDTAPYVPAEAANAAPALASTPASDDPPTEALGDAGSQTATAADEPVAAATEPAPGVRPTGAGGEQPPSRVRVSTVPDAPVGRGPSRSYAGSDPFEKPFIEPETHDEPTNAATNEGKA
jgi:sec-independent protein translocase protein TatB